MKTPAQGYDKANITPELLEKLKQQALLMEDDLVQEGLLSMERTGRLCDPGLCQIGIEYENLCLDISHLEALLKEREKEEGKV